MPDPTTPALTGAERMRVILLGGVLPLAIAGIGIALMVSWIPDLPQEIAIHWNGAGVADGFGSVWTLAPTLATVVVPFSLIGTIAAITSARGAYFRSLPRAWVAISVGLSAMLTVGMTGSVAMQRNPVEGAPAPELWPWLLYGFLGAAILGMIVWFLTPRTPIAALPQEKTPETLELAPEERAFWSRSAGPTRLFFGIFFGSLVVYLGIMVTLTLVLGDAAIWPVLLPIALLLIIVAVMFFWRVRINQDGVVVRGVLGIPVFRIPLAEIETASAVRINPLAEFGGWGVRWGLGGRFGVVLRRGGGLEVRRTSGKIFVVTVDDAETAARLLNGLVARNRAASRERSA